MTTQKAVVAANLDDLLFTNRNKKYGAYELRKNYDKRLAAAVIAAVSFFIITLAGLNMLPNPKQIIDILAAPKTDTVEIILQHFDQKPEEIHKIQARSGGSKWPSTVSKDPDDSNKDTLKMTGALTSGTGINNIIDLGGENGGGLGLFQINHTLPVFKKPFDPDPDIMAQFPGGDQAYENYLKNNIKYPTFAVENRIEGSIYLRLKIDEKGHVVDVSVLKSIGGGCDDEAVRVLKNMPQWKPGRKNGEFVPVIRYVRVQMMLR